MRCFVGGNHHFVIFYFHLRRPKYWKTNHANSTHVLRTYELPKDMGVLSNNNNIAFFKEKCRSFLGMCVKPGLGFDGSTNIWQTNRFAIFFSSVCESILGLFSPFLRSLLLNIGEELPHLTCTRTFVVRVCERERVYVRVWEREWEGKECVGVELHNHLSPLFLFSYLSLFSSIVFSSLLPSNNLGPWKFCIWYSPYLFCHPATSSNSVSSPSQLLLLC